MNDYITEIGARCKSFSKKHKLTVKDVKAVYYLYDDENVCRKKLEIELRRSTMTLARLDAFIKAWIKKNNPDLTNEKFFEDILEDYLAN
jgi:hypothetical protein